MQPVYAGALDPEKWQLFPDKPYPTVFPVADSGSDNFICRVVRHKPDTSGFVPIGAIRGNDNPFFLITRAKPQNDNQVKQQLALRYGVTKVEVEVCLALASGDSLETLANNGGKSIHTVRNQLKSAMSKFSVNRQTELVSLIDRIKSNSL
ncbi:hypothetical protein AB833_12215 [Chromatiales bacterium (ex Bugula neritina AB1)]|nr:hypothetical protein AB833_12215 [Chromatiales bacterium (ex Bugula neritina AB1)]